MRTLSSALTQAQKQPGRRPYVQLQVREFVGYAPRPYWARLYNGNNEPDEPHALAVPADGSLVRLRIDAAAPPGIAPPASHHTNRNFRLHPLDQLPLRYTALRHRPLRR